MKCTICDGEFPEGKHHPDCYSLDFNWDLKQMCPKLYGIIFITAEERIYNTRPYKYKDEILVDEFDNEKLSIIWKGQQKGGSDCIVTKENREIHVCARKKKDSIISTTAFWTTIQKG
jgi:hypothetical protein